VSGYDLRLSPDLQGGVREDIQNNVVDIDTAALTAAQEQATVAEQNRRELASRLPGHGAQIPLPQPYAAAGVGIADVDMPAVGEGYSLTPGVIQAVSKSYGPDRPQYAHESVGGYGFVGGRQEAPIRVWLGSRSAAQGDAAVVVSPSRPSLWSRLFRRGRR
jgi:hypothetical protein